VTEPQGDEQIVELEAKDVSLTVVAPSTIDATRGDTVWLTLEDELVHGFDRETGDRIGDPEEIVAATRASSSTGSQS
jgi:multiple sugar transport system ATP-binding protein